MKTALQIGIVLLVTGIVNQLKAQQEYDGIPSGIKTDTTIFLKFDILNCEDSIYRKNRVECKYHNTKAQMANAQLDKAIQDYPYPYYIMSRSEYEQFGPGNHKFIFDNRFQQGYNSFKYIGASKGRFSYFYILDMELNRKYKAFEKPESWTYQYGMIMRTLMRKIKKI